MGDESRQALVVLVRHGESALTAENRFAGWADVPLSSRGAAEADRAAALIAAEHFEFGTVHSSYLQRSLVTTQVILRHQAESIVQYVTWRLNERHYGELENLNKVETSLRFGKDQVMEWRRNWTQRPPMISRDDPRWPGLKTELYTPGRLPRLQGPLCPRHEIELPPGSLEDLPLSESPADVWQRMLTHVRQVLIPAIREAAPKGQATLVVAHGTPLRCLSKLFEGLSDEEMSDWEIPSGIPIVYTIDSQTLKMVTKRPLVDEDEFRIRKQMVANQSNPDRHADHPCPTDTPPQATSTSKAIQRRDSDQVSRTVTQAESLMD